MNGITKLTYVDSTFDDHTPLGLKGKDQEL